MILYYINKYLIDPKRTGFMSYDNLSCRESRGSPRTEHTIKMYTKKSYTV